MKQCIAYRMHERKCFVDIAYVVAAGQPDCVSRSCKRTGITELGFFLLEHERVIMWTVAKERTGRVVRFVFKKMGIRNWLCT